MVQTPFNDQFNALDTTFWEKSPGSYTPFWARNNITGAWEPSFVTIVNGMLQLRLSVWADGAGYQAQGSEVMTKLLYGYGTYTFRVRAASTSADPTVPGQVLSGNVTGIFNYVGDSDTEIDIEFEGHLPNHVSLGHFKTTGVSHHPAPIDMGVDLHNSFHTYSFEWTATGIKFYVDGVLKLENTQDVPSRSAYVMFNIWPTNSNDFGGTMQVGTSYAYVDWVSFTPQAAGIPNTTGAQQIWPPLLPYAEETGTVTEPEPNVNEVPITVLSANSVLMSAPPSWYAGKYTSMPYYNQGEDPTWPVNAGTIVTENLAWDSRYARQTVLDTDSDKIWVRRGDPNTDTWQDFRLASGDDAGAAQDGVVIAASAQGLAADGNAPQALISITMDDGYVEDYTEVYPQLRARGLVGVVGMITSYLSAPDPSRMTLAQLHELQNEGWEIASHTVNHYSLAGQTPDNSHPPLTLAEAEAELRDSKLALLAEGFKVTNFIYPYGMYDVETRKLVRKYYKSAADVLAGVNTPPFQQTMLYRVPFGAFASTSIHGPSGFAYDSEAYYKYMVDQAIAQKGWVILEMHNRHSAYGSEATFQAQWPRILATFDYIKTKKDAGALKVVTMEQAIQLMGNRVEVGDPASGDYTIIDGTGRLISSTTGPQPRGKHKNSDPITAFAPKQISYTPIFFADAAGFPHSAEYAESAGLLETNRLEVYPGFQFQVFNEYNTGRRWRRFWTNSEVWSPWVELVAGVSPIVPRGSVTELSPPSAFPQGIVSSLTKGYLDPGSFPGSNIGTLITDTTTAPVLNGFVTQRFEDYDNTRSWRRKWRENGTWSAWTEEATVTPAVSSRFVRSVAIGTVPANMWVDVEVPVEGLVWGDGCTAVPLYGLEPGVAWNFWTKPGFIVIRVQELRGVDKPVTTQDWVFSVIK